MGASVLIIDADEGFANEVADALRSIGVEASTTGDGKLGLDLARINLPGAIVLCVELPRMSGYSVCAKLKKDDALRSVPVVITSSEATPETFEQHKKLKSRAEEYLKKPVPAAVVVEVLRPYLNLRDDRNAQDNGEVAILDDLSIDDGPPAVLSDDEAFSSDEAESMEGDPSQATAVLDAPDLADDREIDEVFAALAEPAGNGAANGAMFADAQDEEEALTTVARLVPEGDDHDQPRHGTSPYRPPSLVMGAIATAAMAFPANAETTADRMPVQAAPPGRRPPGHAPAPPAPRAQAPMPAPPPTARAPVAPAPQPAANNEENVRLKRELEALRAELEEAKKASRIEPALSGRPSLGSGSSVSSREVLTLKKERNALEREVISLKDQLSEKVKEIAGWHQREEELEARAVELEEALEQANQDKETLEAQLTSEQSKLAERERHAHEVEGRLADLTKRHDHAGAEIERLKRDLRTSSEDSAKLKSELDAQQKVSADLESLQRELEQTLQARSEEIGKLENEAEAAAAEAAGLRQQIRAKAEEADARARRALELDAELDRAREHGKMVEEAVRQAETERLEAEEHLARAYEKIREDNAVRGKALKALEIALALVKEAGFEDPEGAPPPAPVNGDEIAAGDADAVAPAAADQPS